MLKLLPLLPWLKGETERLLIAAARGSDPELRASAMFDDLPDNFAHLLPAMGQMLSRTDWFQLFSALDSRVEQYPDFFATVRETLLAAIAEETGTAYGIQSDGGTDPQTGRQVINVQGPGASDPKSPAGNGEPGMASMGAMSPAPARQSVRRARDPNAPIERPGPPPSLTGE